MATVTHIIRSYYDPADREKLERETGQRTDDDDQSDDPWQTESSFYAQHNIRAAPTFVPATISYDEWGVALHVSLHTAAPERPDRPATSTADWYRSLTAASSRSAPPVRPSSAPDPRFSDGGLPPPKPLRKHATKDDWFISKALRSEPAIEPSSPAPSLADLLARDPPPLPSEGRFKPPVWLHIGPANKGFGMLQRSGWKEGEGLGAHVVRAGSVDERNMLEVIDLTLSDSEVSQDTFEDIDYDVIHGSVQAYTGETSSAPHMQKSLLTPLPTVLKADRLGIGLKAKTEGPYKQSKKRVTHSTAALVAHIKSAQEMRKNKAAVGRGRRGFAKIHKREEDSRKAMLAYFNE